MTYRAFLRLLLGKAPPAPAKRSDFPAMRVLPAKRELTRGEAP